MRRAGIATREILEVLRGSIHPGMTTMDLEQIAAARIKEQGSKAAFKGYGGYPCVLCASVNSEVVHGIPSPKRVLKDGDIVSLDFGVFVDGYCGDSAITVPVGKVDAKTALLLKTTAASLNAAIAVVKQKHVFGEHSQRARHSRVEVAHLPGAISPARTPASSNSTPDRWKSARVVLSEASSRLTWIPLKTWTSRILKCARS